MFVDWKRIYWYRQKFRLLIVMAAAFGLILWGCGKQETITFSGEIETISAGTILMKNISAGSFDKASVTVAEATYDFDLEEGQLVEVTALPEIRESYPVQVTAVKIVLKKGAERNVSDYFPMVKETRYVYGGMGNEYASFETYTDYIKDGRMQQMVSNGGTVSVRVYEQKDGKLVKTFSKGEVYYREDMMDQSDGSEEVLLMEPLKEGTVWNLKDGRQRTITKVSTDVKTPLGTYKAIEVLTEGGEGTSVDYYAKHIGLVKTLYQTGGLEVSSSLKSIEQGASREEEIRFYYPEVQSGKLFYVNKAISFQTNDVTAKILEDKYKETVNETLGAVLTTDAAIKTLKLDEANTVRIDMNEAFLKGMNAGAGYEGIILKCIANTFGQYFHSNAVIITIEGKPYQSGHIKMKEGEPITVETEQITEKS